MIREAREKLAADLSVIGIPVLAAWPDEPEPPCLFITPPQGGDYVTAGQFPSDYLITVDVVVLVGKTTSNAGDLEALETVVEDVLENTEDWAFRGVDAPAAVTVHGISYLGTVVHLSVPSRLGG